MPTEPAVPTEERKLAAGIFTDMVGDSAPCMAPIKNLAHG